MKMWTKAELSKGTNTLPRAEETVALYLHPRRMGRARRLCDMGRAYLPDGKVIPYWESAFGIESALDGRSFRDILRDYRVWYAVLPPLPKFRGARIRKDW